MSKYSWTLVYNRLMQPLRHHWIAAQPVQETQFLLLGCEETPFFPVHNKTLKCFYNKTLSTPTAVNETPVEKVLIVVVYAFL